MNNFEDQAKLLAEKLDPIYKRPRAGMWRNYAEDFYLMEVARRPGVGAELAEILEYRGRLSAKDRSYFPSSLTKLCVQWQETLDRARTYEPKGKDRSLAVNQAEAFIRRMKDRFGK